MIDKLLEQLRRHNLVRLVNVFVDGFADIIIRLLVRFNVFPVFIDMFLHFVIVRLVMRSVVLRSNIVGPLNRIDMLLELLHAVNHHLLGFAQFAQVHHQLVDVVPLHQRSLVVIALKLRSTPLIQQRVALIDDGEQTRIAVRLLSKSGDFEPEIRHRLKQTSRLRLERRHNLINMALGLLDEHIAFRQLLVDRLQLLFNAPLLRQQMHSFVFL
mmetsp:Transcript_72401/g.115456  ORF Transcript_72401/g.115456 Transcript_72401/m.115456 type:complete len:213 (-) Transcript_72401:202-840(-)